MFRPGNQTMISSRSTDDWNMDSLGELESEEYHNYNGPGEVPKRPKKPTVLSSGEDAGRSSAMKSCRCTEVYVSQEDLDQDGVAFYNTKEEVRAGGSALDNHNYVGPGEVPKRPKRPTVLSSGEDTGGISSTKSCRCTEVSVPQIDQDHGAVTCYYTREEVRKVKQVSKTNFFPKVDAQSKHSQDGTTSEEYIPDDIEYLSSEQYEVQTRSQPSQHSTDHSKSFSQIYSEIFEESRERQQKAERACRAYNVSRSKLRGNRKRSESRERENGSYSSLQSDYSSDMGKISEEFDNQSMSKYNCKAIDGRQLQHIVGFRKNSPFNAMRNSFKRLPGTENEVEMALPIRTFRRSLKRSVCNEGKLESRKTDLKEYYRDKEYYGETSSNRYGPRSVCSKSSVYSSPRKCQRESCNAEETDDRDYPTDCRSVAGTGTTTALTSRDYYPCSSTRHTHHHYRRLESVPKTYQDRGNSPINTKTRRQPNESQNLHIAMDAEEEREGSLCRSSVSVGVQYPSDDEGQDSAEELRSNISDIQSPTPSRKTYCKENVILNFSQLVRNVYDEDREMTDTCGNRKISRDLGVTSEEDVPRQPSQYVFDDGHSDPAAEELTDQFSEGILGHLEHGACGTMADFAHEYDRNENRSEIANELDQINGEAVDELTDDLALSYEEEEGLSPTHLCLNEMSDDQSKPSSDNLNCKSRNSLSLKIYNADEALMEIPEGYQGPAVILDDDADFLDITLTDDEEHIRAKLMAAALTTRTSNPSSSVNSSRKSRRSTDSSSSILSYKPSVIFSRRSEVEEDKAPRNDRISLLAERVLRACANPFPETTEWEPLLTPKAKWQPLEEKDFSKLAASIFNDRENTLDSALQLLSKEFNQKLQRQIKEIAESFH